MSPWDIPFCRRKSRIVLPMLFEMDFTGGLACTGRNVCISAISGTVNGASVRGKSNLHNASDSRTLPDSYVVVGSHAQPFNQHLSKVVRMNQAQHYLNSKPLALSALVQTERKERREKREGTLRIPWRTFQLFFASFALRFLFADRSPKVELYPMYIPPFTSKVCPVM